MDEIRLSINDLDVLVRNLNRTFILIGSSRGVARFQKFLSSRSIKIPSLEVLVVGAQPPYTPEVLFDLKTQFDSRVKFLRIGQPLFFLAVGGGGIMDLAKLLRFGIDNPDFLRLLADPEGPTYFDFGHEDRSFNSLITVPTVSGSGSEVTPYAVLWDRIEGKLSFKGPSLIPDHILSSSDLVDGCGLKQTVAAALDSINQIFESLWNINRSDKSMEYAINALNYVGVWITEFDRKSYTQALMRERMINISFLSGKAISMTGTSICHYLSYPITHEYGVQHGVACAIWQKAVFDLVRIQQPDVAQRIEAICFNAGILSLDSFFDKIEKRLISEFDLPKIDPDFLLEHTTVDQRLKTFIVTDFSMYDLISRVVGK